ncbi:Holliday junction resolvase RuvX [Candidatus Aminicenantes bacterium AC-334-K16]|jgi:putative Holliday junction resolvase|nr:Holliday junction resolvase RuvX [Candidatus Aminicenantes bacterium AC-334-K16]
MSSSPKKLQRILGIDFGDKHLGLAISDPLRLTAQYLGKYIRKSLAEDQQYFAHLFARFDIEEVVVGLPLDMDGQTGLQAQKTKEFARWLEKTFAKQVILWDERLTTKQAQAILHEQKVDSRQRKKYEDGLAATLILANYLESKRPHGKDI